MNKHNDIFKNMRFSAKRKYVLISLDSNSKMREKILFEKKKIDFSMVDDSNIIIIFQIRNMSRDTCRIMGRWKNLTNIVLKWCY